jgi:hypothetical protein
MSFLVTLRDSREKVLSLFALIALSLPTQKYNEGEANWSYKALNKIATLLDLNSDDVVSWLALAPVTFIVSSNEWKKHEVSLDPFISGLNDADLHVILILVLETLLFTTVK